MRKIAKAVFIGLLLAVTNSWGQNYIPKVIPPPPNAASLGIYGQVPISLYTGLPNISIPLYTIQYRDISLPISVSYHAQGVKIEQEASWVGLNWSLNCGGVITRTTRGYDDIMKDNIHIGYPYLTQEVLNGQGDTFPKVDEDLMAYHNQGTNDYEFDIFYFSFAGKSGKFILDKVSYEGAEQKGVIRGIPLSAEKLSITYYSNSTRTVHSPYPGYWEIITEDGYTYRFETPEFTFMRRSIGAHSTFGGYPGADHSCLNAISNGNTGLGVTSALADYNNESVNPSKDSKQVGAWQLNRITSPTGATINFIYDITTNYASLSPLLRTQSGSPFVASGFGFYCYTSQLITKERLLKEIRFGDGKVEFFTEGREDVKTLDISPDPTLASYNITTGPPQRLRQIKISHAHSTHQKVFDFKYAYFNQGKSSEFLRLKLNELVENGIKKHRFEYDERKPLPSKNSLDKDHWGYYNGEFDNYHGVGMLLPMLIYQQPGTSDYQVFNSTSIRRPDQGVTLNAQTSERDYPYMKSGSLTKIIYPTGGSTTFEMEPNTYEHKEIWEANSEIRSDDDSWQRKTITLKNGQSVEFEVAQITFAAILMEGGGAFSLKKYPLINDLVSIVPIDNSSNPTIKYGMSYQCDPVNAPPGNDPSSWPDKCSWFKTTSGGYTIKVLPGRYKITVKNHLPSDGNPLAVLPVSLTFNFPDFNNNTFRIGGGLRVKRTIDSDGVDATKDIVKKYTYITGDSGKV